MNPDAETVLHGFPGAATPPYLLSRAEADEALLNRLKGPPALSAGTPFRKAHRDGMSSSLALQLIDEVTRLLPDYLKDPVDWEMSKGNAAIATIDSDGAMHGRIYGEDKHKSRWVFNIVNRKVIQVWSTGYATGDFETRVYAGQLNEGDFGLNRPDLIGWEGGVPLLTPDGKLLAAAFSGFRGVKDIEIIERAAERVGLKVKRPL